MKHSQIGESKTKTEKNSSKTLQNSKTGYKKGVDKTYTQLPLAQSIMSEFNDSVHTIRSSRRRRSVKKVFFAKFTGNHLCQGLFFNKELQLYSKKALAHVFFCEFCKISKSAFSTEQLRTTASVSN